MLVVYIIFATVVVLIVGVTAHTIEMIRETERNNAETRKMYRETTRLYREAAESSRTAASIYNRMSR